MQTCVSTHMFRLKRACVLARLPPQEPRPRRDCDGVLLPKALESQGSLHKGARAHAHLQYAHVAPIWENIA
eukprot:4090187-Pleurochrysis_carterae.AAC.1